VLPSNRRWRLRERAAGRHRSDRGSRRGGTATRSARRPRHARGHGEGAAWEGGSSGSARAGTEATARRGPARTPRGATQRVGLATFDRVLLKNFERKRVEVGDVA
jgi:hypothetical protein